MTGPVRVLYVTADASTGERLEELFEEERPAVAFSFVTNVERALDVVDAERIDYVVLDADFPDRAAAGEAIRETEVRVGIVSSSPPDAHGDAASERRHYSETERVRILATRVERIVLSETASDGGVEGDRFRTLAEDLTDAVLVIDTESTVRYANPAVADIFGYHPDELVGESLTVLMPDELADDHVSGMTRYLREGERHVDWDYLELPGERRDGTELPLGVSFSELDVDGETRFTGVVRDISERKRRESELHDRIHQQEALAAFARHALEDWPVADLMNEAVELVADALDNEYAGVLEYRSAEDDLLVRAVYGWDEDLANAATIGTERDSQAGYTLLSEEPVVVEDVAIEDRFDRDRLLDSADAVSGVSAIIGSPENPWGILGTHDTDPRSYADYDVQFVQSIAYILTTVLQRRERERRLERSEAMLDAVDDGLYALDAEGRFVAANDAYAELTGYTREQLLGRRAESFFAESLGEEMRNVREALESGDEVVTLEATMTTADGESVPIEASVASLPLETGTGRVGVVRDVSDRKRRERKLTSLNELFRSLTEAETPTEICDLAVEAAVETLDFPNVTVALYDDEASELVATAQRWTDGEIDDALVGRHAEDVAWQAFVSSETKAFENLDAELDADTEMGSALAVPLGKYGVFLAATPEPNGFDSTDRSLADMLCSNVRTALNRAEREDTLRDQRNDLQEKNRELERVNRLNSVIRDITKALTQASAEDDAMQAVCERLTETGPYRFAWFGTYNRATGEIRPEAGAGVEDGYLEAVTVTAKESDAEGGGPAGRAVRTGEVQVQNDLLGDPPFDPWREQALKRGYRSCVSVPVSYDEMLHGVLTVYADETGVFDDLERAVLSELGDTIGYALNALEQKQALVSERSIELDFRIRGSESPILAFAADTGAKFEFQNAVQREDGRLHTFFTIEGATPDETLAFADSVPWIEDVRLVTERDDASLFECTLADRTFLRSLMDRGAVPRTIMATEDGGRFVVRIPQRADVRTFVNHFEDYYGEAELVARRERDDPVMTRQDFEAELADRLTDRQREVVKLAYFGGYFEWPRGSTAEEIAEALGVSQPTVSRHVRSAERALFGLLFENE
ncbi:PAS domain S-box protein [Halorussus gelatinilyticus]|uniref:PAS domain S-box protein n=1 Tax=Halorussus gelatinilyticus TaxID=2937524 RepID=A0A8U0IFZ8_9EURY|nr:PAS domain S-box protein [Halorussus gelatinilyticus]UPV99620.1 PAS domain S-box protein [Halorussus gelatinilyticus]